MGNQSQSTQPVPARAARSRFSWSMKHRQQQPQDSPNSAPPQCPPLQLSTSITAQGKTTEILKKSGFSYWQPCQAATEFESGWSLSQYCRGISIRECKLYAILTTKTSESITDLTEPHNALDRQSSPPTPPQVPQCQQPSVTTWAPALHTGPAQLRLGPAALTTTKLNPRCGYAGTAQLEQCNEEDKLCLSLPHPEAAWGILQSWQTLTLGSWQAPKGIYTGCCHQTQLHQASEC